MAWVLELTIECGRNQAVACAVERQLAECGALWPTGIEGDPHALYIVQSTDEDGSVWVTAMPAFRQRAFLQLIDPPDVLRYWGGILYEYLKKVSGYRFARVGIEVEQFNSLDNLRELIEQKRPQGLVLREDICQSYGSPPSFEAFSPGYLWIPRPPEKDYR